MQDVEFSRAVWAGHFDVNADACPMVCRWLSVVESGVVDTDAGRGSGFTSTN